MANYPIKLLKDETNAAFVPLVSTDCIRDKDNQTLQQILDKKLSPANLLPGEHVSITTEDNNCYVNVDLPAGLTLIDNLNTTTANQGSLDAHQGKVLKDMIPEIIDDITDTSPTKGLSANQGYVLNNKFSNYTTTEAMNTKFNNYLLLTGGTLTGDLKINKATPVLEMYATNTTAQTIKMGDSNYKYNLVTSYGNGTTYGANTAIQNGGAMLIGGGESSINLLTALGPSTYDKENLFAIADGAVYLESNCQDINNRLGFVLNSAGELLPVKKETLATSSGTIGNASYKLKALYVDDVYLSTGAHSIRGTGNKDVLRDHGNGHVTLDATGGDLYLGWQKTNTSRINIFDGKMFITQSGGARIEPQTNSGGAWISMTHGEGAALYNSVRNGASPGSNASALWGIKTNAGAWGCGVLSGSDSLYFVYGTDSNYNSGTNTAATAYISSAGAFTSASARETKENIQPYTDNALDIINDTLICSFNYKADNHKSYRVGFIADDTNSIMSGEEHDSFDINNTVGLLLKAVQELDEKNKKLEERIKQLEEE